MKKLLFLLLVLSVFSARAQTDSTFARAIFGFKEEETQELAFVMNVEKYTISFKDALLKGKVFNFTMKEYKEGVLVNTKKFITNDSQKDFYRFDKIADSLVIKAYALQKSANRTKVTIRFPRVGKNIDFDVSMTDADRYSLRTDILDYKNGLTKIPVNRSFPFLVYTLPYESDGFLLYCSLAQSKVPVEQWYQKFKIKHFAVFELKIED